MLLLNHKTHLQYRTWICVYNSHEKSMKRTTVLTALVPSWAVLRPLLIWLTVRGSYQILVGLKSVSIKAAGLEAMRCFHLEMRLLILASRNDKCPLIFEHKH